MPVSSCMCHGGPLFNAVIRAATELLGDCCPLVAVYIVGLRACIDQGRTRNLRRPPRGEVPCNVVPTGQIRYCADRQMRTPHACPNAFAAPTVGTGRVNTTGIKPNAFNLAFAQSMSMEIARKASLKGVPSQTALRAVENCSRDCDGGLTKIITASSHSEKGSFLTSGLSWLCHLRKSCVHNSARKSGNRSATFQRSRRDIICRICLP
jgi:hypothetical protein